MQRKDNSKMSNFLKLVKGHLRFSRDNDFLSSQPQLKEQLLRAAHGNASELHHPMSAVESKSAANPEIKEDSTALKQWQIELLAGCSKSMTAFKRVIDQRILDPKFTLFHEHFTRYGYFQEYTYKSCYTDKNAETPFIISPAIFVGDIKFIDIAYFALLHCDTVSDARIWYAILRTQALGGNPRALKALQECYKHLGIEMEMDDRTLRLPRGILDNHLTQIVNNSNTKKFLYKDEASCDQLIKEYYEAFIRYLLNKVKKLQLEKVATENNWTSIFNIAVLIELIREVTKEYESLNPAAAANFINSHLPEHDQLKSLIANTYDYKILNALAVLNVRLINKNPEGALLALDAIREIVMSHETQSIPDEIKPILLQLCQQLLDERVESVEKDRAYVYWGIALSLNTLANNLSQDIEDKAVSQINSILSNDETPPAAELKSALNQTLKAREIPSYPHYKKLFYRVDHHIKMTLLMLEITKPDSIVREEKSSHIRGLSRLECQDILSQLNLQGKEYKPSDSHAYGIQIKSALLNLINAANNFVASIDDTIAQSIETLVWQYVSFTDFDNESEQDSAINKQLIYQLIEFCAYKQSRNLNQEIIKALTSHSSVFTKLLTVVTEQDENTHGYSITVSHLLNFISVEGRDDLNNPEFQRAHANFMERLTIVRHNYSRINITLSTKTVDSGFYLEEESANNVYIDHRAKVFLTSDKITKEIQAKVNEITALSAASPSTVSPMVLFDMMGVVIRDYLNSNERGLMPWFARADFLKNIKTPEGLKLFLQSVSKLGIQMAVTSHNRNTVLRYKNGERVEELLLPSGLEGIRNYFSALDDQEDCARYICSFQVCLYEVDELSYTVYLDTNEQTYRACQQAINERDSQKLASLYQQVLNQREGDYVSVEEVKAPAVAAASLDDGVAHKVQILPGKLHHQKLVSAECKREYKPWEMVQIDDDEFVCRFARLAGNRVIDVEAELKSAEYLVRALNVVKLQIADKKNPDRVTALCLNGRALDCDLERLYLESESENNSDRYFYIERLFNQGHFLLKNKEDKYAAVYYAQAEKFMTQLIKETKLDSQEQVNLHNMLTVLQDSKKQVKLTEAEQNEVMLLMSPNTNSERRLAAITKELDSKVDLSLEFVKDFYDHYSDDDRITLKGIEALKHYARMWEKNAEFCQKMGDRHAPQVIACYERFQVYQKAILFQLNKWQFAIHEVRKGKLDALYESDSAVIRVRSKDQDIASEKTILRSKIHETDRKIQQLKQQKEASPGRFSVFNHDSAVAAALPAAQRSAGPGP